MKNIDLNHLEATTGGCAPAYCYPPPACAPVCAPRCMPPVAAQWRWAAHQARAEYRAAAAYAYGGWAPAARWWR